MIFLSLRSKRHQTAVWISHCLTMMYRLPRPNRKKPQNSLRLPKILPPMKTNGSMSKFRQKKFCPNFSRSKPLKRKNRPLRNSLPRFLRTMTTGDIIRQRKNFRQKIFLPNR